jgi:hypothetical protein
MKAQPRNKLYSVGIISYDINTLQAEEINYIRINKSMCTCVRKEETSSMVELYPYCYAYCHAKNRSNVKRYRAQLVNFRTLQRLLLLQGYIPGNIMIELHSSFNE